MKKLIIAAALIGSIGIGSIAYADNFAFSFDTGSVGFAFRDGYWDRDHHWHRWHNEREHRAYRERFADHYYDRRHSYYRNSGWADFDHDGVPNRLDAAPYNPYRQ